MTLDTSPKDTHMGNSHRSLIAWAFYDFATSIAVVVYLIYFSQWLVIDHHVADLWYNLLFVGSSILLVATVPFTSVIADRLHHRMIFLRITTLCQFAFFLGTGIVASYFPLNSLTIAVAACLYLGSLYSHQFALVFYNALLPDVARQNAIGAGSGWGQMSKSVGTVCGVLLSIPFAHGSFHILGHSGRSQPFLPATVVSFVLTLPCLFQKEPAASNGIERTSRPGGYTRLFRELYQTPGVLYFLLGFFLFNDAVLTVQDNLPIYMQRVLAISDKVKSLLIGMGLLAAALGAILGGKLADKIGLKRSLLGVLGLWIALLPTLSAVRRVGPFGLISTLIGLTFGATWSISRALMARLAPRNQLSHAFGYYSIVERFSTLFGPLAWGIVVTVLANRGPVRYSIALLSMVAFIVLGLIMVIQVPAQRSDSL